MWRCIFVDAFLFMPATPFLLPPFFVTHCDVKSQLFVSIFIMSSRRQLSVKGVAFSPEKDRCAYCGRVVVAGPMGLSRHLARNPDCQLEYSMEHNSSCQQSFTGFTHDDCNRRSDDVFIHTNNASSSGVDQVARRPLKDNISNSKPVDDNFPIFHDNSDDEHVSSPRAECVVGKSFVVLSNTACPPTSPHVVARPPTQPAIDSGTDADVDTSILDAYIARSESLNDGLSLSLFSVEEKVQVDLLQLSRDFVLQSLPTTR